MQINLVVDEAFIGSVAVVAADPFCCLFKYVGQVQVYASPCEMLLTPEQIYQMTQFGHILGTLRVNPSGIE